VATGTNAVMIDLTTFVWANRGTLLGGARFSAAATLLVSNNSLASDTAGQLSAGGGLADFYFQPFILGWTTDRAAIRTAYGVLAPSGYASRWTFYIGADGRILDIDKKVNAATHGPTVVARVAALANLTS